MSLAEFPPEILANIFNYLPVHEVINVSDVNKQWRDIASNLLLIPKGHLLLRHAPPGVRKTPVHTIHIDGSQNIREDFNQIETRFQLTDVTVVALYGQWTILRLTELSQCLHYVPRCTTLEISNASPASLILDFLLIKHDITKVRCFLRTEKQLRLFRRLCDYFRRIHGLFEEVLVSLEMNKELQVYAPKLHSFKYPNFELTSILTIHPARLSIYELYAIRDLKGLKCLTLNYLKEIPKNILTNLSSSSRLKKLALHNARGISHDSWKSFFQCPLVASLEQLCVSGKTQIDSSIFDTLEKNYNLRKLYIVLNSPCFSEDCHMKSMLLWSPNIEVLVLGVPFSLVGLEDLLSINKRDVRKLRTFKILFQLTPDMAEPYGRLSLEESQNQIRKNVLLRLPNVSVSVEYKRHFRDFLCEENDFD